MTALPAAGYPSNAARTNTEIQGFMEDILARMKEMPGGQARAAVTISAGVLTNIAPILYVATESAAAYDELDRVNDASEDGSIKFIVNDGTGAVMVMNDAATGLSGNLLMKDGRPCYLVQQYDTIGFVRQGNDWIEFTRSVQGKRAILYRTTDQTIIGPTGVATGIGWEAKIDNFVNLPTPIWTAGFTVTIPESARIIQIAWGLEFESGEGGTFRRAALALASAGTEYGLSGQTVGYRTADPQTTLLNGYTARHQVSGGDTFTLSIHHDSGANINVKASDYTFVSMDVLE